MVTQEQAEQLVYEHINRPWPSRPGKPEMIIIRVVERPLDWIVYWTSRTFWENPESDQEIASHGPCLVSRADGKLFETGTTPPIEDIILATEHKIQSQFRRTV